MNTLNTISAVQTIIVEDTISYSGIPSLLNILVIFIAGALVCSVITLYSISRSQDITSLISLLSLGVVGVITTTSYFLILLMISGSGEKPEIPPQIAPYATIENPSKILEENLGDSFEVSRDDDIADYIGYDDYHEGTQEFQQSYSVIDHDNKVPYECDVVIDLNGNFNAECYASITGN